MDQSTFDSSEILHRLRGIGAIAHPADNPEAAQTGASSALDLKNPILIALY